MFRSSSWAHAAVLGLVLALPLGCAVTLSGGGSDVGSEREGGDIDLGWRLFNRKGVQVETFPVGEQHGAFSAVRLVTSSAPIEVHAVVVLFDNNQESRLRVDKVLAKDSSTAWLDLPGGSRRIREVRIKGKSRDKLVGKIEILGRR